MLLLFRSYLQIEQVMPKGWRESSVVERLPGMYRSWLWKTPLLGAGGGGGGSVVRVIDGCISLRTLVWIPSISVKIWV